jgi:hypothetical protein
MENRMNSFEARRSDRKARQADRAARLSSEASSMFGRAREAIAGIPPGQPILVGHHSEKRHRHDLERHDTRMRKAIDLQKAAEEAARRAATESTAISSDDPDAPDKIRERITALEHRQEMMTAANKVYRNKKLTDEQKVTKLIELGLSDKAARGGLEKDFAGRIGFPGYALTNNNANMRRLRQRLADLEAKAKATARPDVVGDGWVIREDLDDNRLLIMFTGVPDAARRAKLKSNGFRWSPTRSAWVRQLNNRARYCAQWALE